MITCIDDKIGQILVNKKIKDNNKKRKSKVRSKKNNKLIITC